jgi:cyclopropane-fatty-acyl-phospholipid synthase
MSHASTAPFAQSARAVSWMETAVLDAFAAMPRGRLRLTLPGGETREFGDPTAPAAFVAPDVSSHATMQIHRPAFFRKCVLGGDIGFAESYLDGDWDTPDLTAVVGWFLLNVDTAPTLSGSRRAAWR